MIVRDRILELRRIPAEKLVPNSKNWRIHTDKQKSILRGLLNDIGYADALLARELPDGSFQLVDGHLRAETTPDQMVPVLILDIDDAEADKLITLLDPLASLAETDHAMLDELVRAFETSDASVREYLVELTSQNDTVLDHSDCAGGREIMLPQLFQIVIECEDEEQQSEIYEEMSARGLKIRILNL